MKTIFLICVAAVIALACDSINDDYPAYGPEAVVCTPYQAQKALDQGSIEVIIRKPLSADATLTIPKTYPSDATLSITVDACGNNLTIVQGKGSDDYPLLTLFLLSPVQDLTLAIPDIPVTVKGDVEGNLIAANTDQ